MARDNEGDVMTPALAEAPRALRGETGLPLVEARHGGLDVEVRSSDDALWIILRRNGDGGLTLRLPVFGRDGCARVLPAEGTVAAIEYRSSVGHATLHLSADPFELEQFRAQYCFTPTADLRIGKLPRDIVVFGRDGEPIDDKVAVEAQQRKLNTALLYFTLERPSFGKVLYLQNLSSLNAYFNATGSKPENAVQCDWPEMGYSPPLNPESGSATLPAGKSLMLYDTILAVRAYPQNEEADSAWQFLDMIGAIYPLLSPPKADFRDWPARAEATVRDLMHAPEARIEHFGHVYFHPYTASEYPDVMVQLAIASALDDWSRWKGLRHPLVRQIMAGIEGFHDSELGTLRRYLPNVGKDKNANAVDSWYLYHPMLNLANLAIAGDDQARELFLTTIDYGIKAAHHFGYKWPIMYDIRDFSVIEEVADADQRGQTDVGGIYAWVMLQAFELTLERRFIDEAIAAIETAKGMRFDLNYQANLTAWGAAACIRLWRITGRKDFLKQSYVYLASFFHNAQIWNSDIGLAKQWKNFLGVTCLQDAPYMAAYECFDSFSAFERYLDYGGPDLIPSVRLLLSEYCRYALDRAWFYYPDALPEDGVAKEGIRNGYIMNNLNFPLEDLYPDGQPAGQVGQEIYGCGAAMIFATRSFRRIAGAPFLLWSDVFIHAVHRIDSATISLRIDGPAGTEARIALVPEKAGLPKGLRPRLSTSGGKSVCFAEREGRLEARVPADASLLLAWENC